MKKNNLKTLWALFVVFFKAGTFTFAGGLAMLPLIEKDIVETHKMMSKDEFMEYATLSQTLPGIIAINCASFVGKHAAGTLGMLAAGFGASVSAFVLMIAATIAMQYIPQEGPVMGAVRCIRAASAALIFSAAFSLGRHNLKSVFSVVVMLIAFSLVLFLNVSVPLVVFGACIVGYIHYRYFAKADKGAKNTKNANDKGGKT